MTKKGFLIVLSSILTLGISQVVLAAPNGAMEQMARSMVGVTDVYYQNQYVVNFVQFMVSWLCITALIVYYAGWLCSMVTLSNKELFYLVDAIKKGGEGGGNSAVNSDGKGFSMVSTVIAAVRNGNSQSGATGGLDNIIVFFLAMSINFKAYSFYRSVEAGGGTGGGGAEGSGGKFSYEDTLLGFVLKTLIPSVTITVITSIAISGTLIGCWFTIGDIFIVNANRFAQANLVALVDKSFGVAGGYKFTLASLNTRGGVLAETVATNVYASIVSQYPNATADQIQAIGLAVEEAVSEKVLGGDWVDYYSHLQDAVRKTMPAATQDSVVISSEEQAAFVTVANMITNTNSGSNQGRVITFNLDEIAKSADVLPDTFNGEFVSGLYTHVVFRFDASAAGTFLRSNNNSGNNNVVPDTLDDIY